MRTLGFGCCATPFYEYWLAIGEEQKWWIYFLFQLALALGALAPLELSSGRLKRLFNSTAPRGRSLNPPIDGNEKNSTLSPINRLQHQDKNHKTQNSRKT